MVWNKTLIAMAAALGGIEQPVIACGSDGPRLWDNGIATLWQANDGYQIPGVPGGGYFLYRETN